MPRTFAPDALTFKDALNRLREGNKRFVSGEGTAVRAWHPGLTEGQAPIATVLGCSDSRAPAEYVFDQGLGDLFVIRVAGNIIAPSLVGSVEFASSQFGTRLVVVMGHTQCGAIGATMQALEAEGAAESRNQQSIVDRIKPHVAHLAARPDSPSASNRAARLAAAVHANVLASARELRRRAPSCRTWSTADTSRLSAAVYDLATGVATSSTTEALSRSKELAEDEEEAPDSRIDTGSVSTHAISRLRTVRHLQARRWPPSCRPRPTTARGWCSPAARTRRPRRWSPSR